MIDFILYYEKCTKHEAIKKAEAILGGENKTAIPTKNNSTERTMFLERMFTYFKNAVHNSPPAKEYLQKRGLDFKQTEVGYNAGQFHHGARKDEALIKECLEYGVLLDLGMKARTGDIAYKPFGKWCVCFALRNKENQITGLYFRSTLNDKEQRHFYIRDRQGLYPGYPKAQTKKLILTESIIDAATLLQQEQIKNNYEILSLYGTNGLTEEHQKAIRDLQQLEEIIFFLNGDDAGIKAVAKYAPMLKAEYPNLKITNVAVPQNEDVNSLLQGHSPEILIHLLDTGKEFDFIFSSEQTEKENEQQKLPFSITLGHEIAHGLANVQGVKFNSWTTIPTESGDRTLSQSEIYATHIENNLRAERGLPLRTYYSQDGDGNPTYETRILDSKRRSLYYNTGNTSPTGNSYPKTVPGANRYIYRKPK